MIKLDGCRAAFKPDDERGGEGRVTPREVKGSSLPPASTPCCLYFCSFSRAPLHFPCLQWYLISPVRNFACSGSAKWPNVRRAKWLSGQLS